MRKWYEIKALADDEAEVYIYAEIGEDFWGDGSSVSAREFVKELQAIEAKHIALHVNSPGGSCFDGQAIFTSLKNHPAKVTTYIDGVALSIASLVALAGDRVVMAENALFMIHEPRGCVCGDAAGVRKYVEILEKSGAAMRGVYEARSALTDEEVAAAMAEETWYLAAEALEAGFVDEVADNISVAALAHFDPKALGFKHVPPEIIERMEPEAAGEEPGDTPAGDTSATLLPRVIYLKTMRDTRHGGLLR